MAAPAGGFGSGLGTLVGGYMAADQLNNTQGTINADVGAFNNTVQPYNSFGQSFLNPAVAAQNNIESTAENTQGYNQFMANYTNTPAAQYQLQQANAVQNNSAAASGNLLSGSNLRALGTIDNGIVSQNANTAYNEYLSGSNTQFGQLESSLGNMFQAIGVGQTATGQQEALANTQLNATTSLGEAQAKNDQGKGSGIGSMLGGLPTFSF